MLHVLRRRVPVAMLLLLPAAAHAGMHGEEEYLIVPKGYTPARSWPVIVVSQNQVSEEQMATVPYFAVFGSSAGIAPPLLEVAKKYNIDPFRVYATGFSRSGHGLLEVAWTYPHRFAGIAPVCEDMRIKAQYKRQKVDLLKHIQHTPTYLWHGDHDSFRKTGKVNYERMKAAGCPVQFGYYRGGHNPDPIYFKDIRKLTDFFDRHVLDPYPRRVTHVVYRYGATRAFWVDARVGTASVEKEYPVFTVAVREGNRIEVEATEGVKRFIFHLNERLVDMSKPVVVALEGKQVYRGKAQPGLTVTLRDGAVDEKPSVPPLWKQLEAIRTQPNEAGAFDWLYLDMHAAFADPRLGRPVARRISLDLGVKATDGPPTAKILPTSKGFVSLDVTKPDTTAVFDMSSLERKVPVRMTADVQRFSLTDAAGGAADGKPVRLVPAGEGRAGEAVLVRVRLANGGSKAVTVVARLNRSPFMTYPIGMWPKDEALAGFVTGIYEVAGTRGVSWQYLKHGNEAYQVLGFLMLYVGDAPKVTPLMTTPRGYRKGFYGVRRYLSLAAGASVDLPLLLISVPSPDPKSLKPQVPDLARIIEHLKPALLKVIGEVRRPQR